MYPQDHAQVPIHLPLGYTFCMSAGISNSAIAHNARESAQLHMPHYYLLILLKVTSVTLCSSSVGTC